jgi:hypothetical protein
MLSACVSSNFSRRDIFQAWAISSIFLVLLFTSPSALLIFWTCNNLWGLLLNMRAYWIEEKKNPAGAMFRTFLSTMRSIPAPMFEPESRFNRISFLIVFLVGFHAMTAAYLNILDTAQITVALSIGICVITFQILFLAKRLRQALRYIAWFFAVALGSAYYSFLWEKTAAAREPVFTLMKVTASVIGGDSGKFFVVSAALYLCSMGLLLFSARRCQPAGATDVRRSDKWDYAMLAMAVIAPATFQAGNNLDYLNAHSVWIYYGFLTVFAFLFCAIICLIWRNLISRHDVMTAVSAYMFCMILNPSVQGHLKRYGSPTLLFAAIFAPAIAWALLKRRNTRNIAIFFTILAFLALFNLALGAKNTEAYIPSPEEGASTVNIPEENRVNIFLLVYDAMPDLRTLENLTADPKPLEKILRDNNFKIYEDTYSLSFDSITSMSRTFNIMRDSARYDRMRDMCAGNSRVFSIFKKNSYNTRSIQSHYLTGGKSFTDDSFPKGRQYDLDTGNALLAMLLTGIFSGEFRFDIEGIGPSGGNDFHEYIRAAAADRDGLWFTTMHAHLPGHSQNSGKLLPNETELFIERYNTVLPVISKDIEAILDNKPDSVVIVIGDHGPQITGDGFMLNGYSFDEITELMIRDRFGTLIAIRWPDAERAAKYDSNLLMNHDIFPVVFAYLADSPEPLELMLKNKKLVFKDMVFLNNGVWAGSK